MIDSFARSSLWRAGLDYRHGTGHGVGAGLNVHEGPCGISTRHRGNTEGLKKGMVLSNEPGYYEDNAFGIRIENLVHIEEDKAEGFGGKQFLKFTDLTMVPIQKKLIAAALLTQEEQKWLDGYHAEVWETLAPRIQDPGTKAWLKKACFD